MYGEYNANKETRAPVSSFLATGRRMSEELHAWHSDKTRRAEPARFLALLETDHVALDKPKALSVLILYSSLEPGSPFFEEKRVSSE